MFSATNDHEMLNGGPAMADQACPKFLNTPWRVEREAGAAVVVDCKNLIVASFDFSEPEELGGTVEDEIQKAYSLAAIPAIYEKGRAFLEVLADPVRCQDEALVSAGLDALDSALASAHVPEEARG